MQLGRIVVIIAMLVPVQPALAESAHFEPASILQNSEFASADNTFKLSIPTGVYQQPLDVYLFRLPATSILAQLNPLTEIYSYYVYSSEVTDQTEFNLTISYKAGDHASGKTVYYLNPQSKNWELASQQAFLNNLTFKLKGQANQLVVVGTNLAVKTIANGGKIQVSETFNFNVQPELSQLKYDKICSPYLTGYFKSAKTNSAEEVKKLQSFLNKYEGFVDLPSTGYYGSQTQNAVKQFQERYAGSVLAPHGLNKGTGWVLETTLAKINQVYCQKNPDASSYQVILPYKTPSKQAKNAYWLNNGEWELLESYDNYKNQTVTAIIDESSVSLAGAEPVQVALFEETTQWVGEASWYAWKNGNYAASRDFPKGTKLKVTNQAAGKFQGQSVIVEINDYGPEIRTGRIIDLDKVAFKQIGLTSSGVLPVKIEVVK
ncbi:MAG: RlpA-like double-psi beta-barrel domain-containing protein [Candidatus Komeilibacteria bacterium]|nr:RlpA-like double-psi beta-barrel domain-containing protein [Candidatus Komeilibacteria bacterium]